MTGLRAWFAGRSRREQRLLLVMVALLVVTILWALILRPMGDALAGSRERHAAAVGRLGETATRIEALRAATRDAPPPLGGALADVVRVRAEQAGFPLGSVEPDGAGGVRVAIVSARGAALVAWLARLERAGIVVASAALDDNGDRTVAARLTLRPRAT